MLSKQQVWKGLAVVAVLSAFVALWNCFRSTPCRVVK